MLIRQPRPCSYKYRTTAKILQDPSGCCNINGEYPSIHCSGNTFFCIAQYLLMTARLCQPWYAALNVPRRSTSSFQNTSLWCFLLLLSLFFRHQLTSGDWGRNTFSVTSLDSFQTSWIPLLAECLSIIYNRKYDIYLPETGCSKGRY